MPKIDLAGFAGVYPILDEKTMPSNYATEATNVELRRGKILAARGLLDLDIPLMSTTGTIYLYNKDAGGFWFQFDNENIDVVRGPLAGDTELVTYITGGGPPRYTKTDIAQAGSGPYPSATRTLGVPKPPILSVDGTPATAPNGEQEITTSYVQTYVSDLNEEGPPSDPTGFVTRWDGREIPINGLSVPTGNFVINRRRIYRVELAGVFQLVAEIPISDDSFIDDVFSERLGTPVPTEGWVSPDSSMIGLTALPNGVLAGFYGNTLAFCEPFFLHAWPTEYEKALQDDVVGVAVSAAGLVVCTDGQPVIVYGNHPSAYSVEKLDIVQPCVSKRSIVDMGNEVVYASPDGLVAVGPGVAGLITRDFILPEQWRTKFNPSSIHAYKFDDEYLGFYKTESQEGAFIFNPARGFRFFDIYSDAVYSDPEDGRLLLKQGDGLFAWDEGNNLTSTWKSKEFLTPENVHFTHLKVDADTYPLQLEISRDGDSVTKEITSDRKQRLGSRNRYRVLSISASGESGISRIQLATSAAEIN